MSIKTSAAATLRHLFSGPLHSLLVYKACRLYVNTFSGNANPDIRTNGEWKVMRDYLPNADVIMDVGANQGDWARLALQVSPAAQIHCFEPNPQMFLKLKDNRWPSNVFCRQAALGAEEGSAQLFAYPSNSTVSSLHRRTDLAWLDEEPVPTKVSVRTLDDYCDENAIERISFLKIDVEGHEHEVLSGGRRVLEERRIDHIQFEYSGGYLQAGSSLRSVYQMLTQLGYRVGKIKPRGIHWHQTFPIDEERFITSNWFAAAAK